MPDLVTPRDIAEGIRDYLRLNLPASLGVGNLVECTDGYAFDLGGAAMRVMVKRLPVADDHPDPSGRCGTCGHFAVRHGPSGCTGIRRVCPCKVFLWRDTAYPVPSDPSTAYKVKVAGA